MYAQVCNDPPILIKIWLHFSVTTTSTKQSPKFLRQSRNSSNCMEPDAHYCVHKNPSLVSILSQINGVHAKTSRSLKIPYFPVPLRSTCLDRPILHLITPIESGEKHKSCSSSVCNFRHSPVTPLRPKYPPQRHIL